MKVSFPKLVLATALYLGCMIGQATAQPILKAIPSPIEPKIDGNLSEPCWRRIKPVHLTQRNPFEGAPPDQKTDLMVIYTSDAIFIGLRLWDNEPQKIHRGLGRRDAPPPSDGITVLLDTMLSKNRAYAFSVNAAGVMQDGLFYNDTEFDASWDGRWDVATAIDEKGWIAEFRIPLSTITFQDQTKQNWGFCVSRWVQRNHQTSTWPPLPKDTNTFVSGFGLLT
ncbi:MAG: carbohydrate binding family 9 domain-containing protein, partial [Pseudomonadota bacterium]